MGSGNNNIELGDGIMYVNYGKGNQKAIAAVTDCKFKVKQKFSLLKTIELLAFKSKIFKMLGWKIFCYRMKKLYTKVGK